MCLNVCLKKKAYRMKIKKTPPIIWAQRKENMLMKNLRLFALAASLLLVSCTLTPSSSSSIASSSSSVTTSSSVVTSSSVTSSSSSVTSSASSSALREFTLTELATYNGDSGGLAYIAVNGTVYDVTNVAEWENGWHKGMHLAGTDCTTAFAGSPHSLGFLSSLTIVGTLV